MKASIAVFAAVFFAGCSFGVGPHFKKINKNGAFLLQQKYNKDIICFKAGNEKSKQDSQNVRCYYVSADKAVFLK